MNILFLILLFIYHVSSHKLISISAGGLKGFYMFGICKYLKNHYDLKDVVFYGASAGAWNSLYLSHKMDIDPLDGYLRHLKRRNFKNLFEIEELLTKHFYSYNNNDFDLSRIHICLCVLNKYYIEKRIINNFDDLHDALECCKASSHIPYFTNNHPVYYYKNLTVIDGGFFPVPHYNYQKPDLFITPNIFKNNYLKNYCDIKNLNIKKLIDLGYQDAKKNKKIFDEIF